MRVPNITEELLKQRYFIAKQRDGLEVQFKNAPEAAMCFKDGKYHLFSSKTKNIITYMVTIAGHVFKPKEIVFFLENPQHLPKEQAPYEHITTDEIEELYELQRLHGSVQVVRKSTLNVEMAYQLYPIKGRPPVTLGRVKAHLLNIDNLKDSDDNHRFLIERIEAMERELSIFRSRLGW